MSISICTECLSRLRVSSRPSAFTAVTSTVALPQTSSFHSSAAQHASVLKKKNAPVLQGARRSTGVRLKKKARERVTLPAVGERRAARHRIVISNTNALEVMGMETLNAENILKEESSNRVFALHGQVLDQLRDCQAFKRTQNWNMFRQPATLVRSETLEVARAVDDVVQNKGKTAKLFVAGERQSGKSILLLQAMYLAFLKNWIVINVPEAQAFTFNNSSYAPLRTKPIEGASQTTQEQLYIQPHLAQALLNRLAYANEKVLKSLKLNHEHPKNLRVKPSASLSDLALIGVQDHTLAVSVWDAVWKELNTPGVNPRPPILLTVDGVDHWMGPSRYRSADFQVLHAQQFTLVKQFTELLFSGSAKPALSNGGMILFATTGSNTPSLPSFDTLLSQFRARDRGVSPSSPAFPTPAPYSKPDTRVTNLFSKAEDVKFMEVSGTTQPESKGLLEYFAQSGLFQQTVTEQVVARLRALSAGGVVGELAKLGKRVTA